MRKLVPLATAVLSVTAVVGVQLAAAHPAPQQPTAAAPVTRRHASTPPVVPTVQAQPIVATPSATPIAATPIVAQPLAAGPDQGVPPCDGKDGRPAHDVTKWHALVERNADGSILCSYGHEHGSNPRVLDNVFGSLAQNIGQEISYPWHTTNENDDSKLPVTTSNNVPIQGGKHRFYKWEVLTATELQASGKPVCENPFAPYSFDNARMEVHADGNAGATIRFHSFYVEAETCDPQDPSYHGSIKIGGHFDYGHLEGYENTPTGQQDVIIPLPGIDPPYMAGQGRKHGTTSGSCPGCTGLFRGDFTWYGASNTREFQQAVSIGVSDGIREQDWGPVDPNNPTGPVQFYGTRDGQTYNHGSGISLDILGIGVPASSNLPGATLRDDWTFDWTGHVDRHGNIVTCSTVGTDCIPVTFQNVKKGSYQYSNDEPNRELPATNYDVKGPTGQSLIEFPN